MAIRIEATGTITTTITGTGTGTVTIMLTGIRMATTDAAPLVRLLTMLSPAFPVGAFSFSSGLEQATAAGPISDEASLREWLADVLHFGALWNDAVLLAESWRLANAGDPLDETNELALALAGSAGRFTETTAQGRAFVDAAREVWPVPEFPGEPAYCVAVGAVSASAGIALGDVLAAFLNAAVSNQLQAAIRLSLTGQKGAVKLLAALEPEILAIAGKAAISTPDDLGSAALMAEIAAMNHDTLGSRIFRT